MSSKLGSLILSEKVVTFDFPGCDGLSFDLTYLSKDEIQRLSKACTVTKFDKKTRMPIEELDSDTFLEKYVAKTIRGWKGFKLKYLNEFMLVDLSKQDPEEELEFSEEDALQLMQNSNVFDTWVSEQISDLGKFNTDSLKKNTNALDEL